MNAFIFFLFFHFFFHFFSFFIFFSVFQGRSTRSTSPLGSRKRRTNRQTASCTSTRAATGRPRTSKTGLCAPTSSSQPVNICFLSPDKQNHNWITYGDNIWPTITFGALLSFSGQAKS